VSGGATRFHSVKNGLSKINDNESLVAIHDGVRPLIQPEIIDASFRLAQIHGCAVACTQLKESLRIVDKDHTKTTDRTKYRSIQTPQTFQTKLIKAAYNKFNDAQGFTDDASVAEKNGQLISLFEGSYENIKITTPVDLQFAEAIIKQRKKR
jgi:2-C-methyl-D-erythritol 4-phosphate cytidylyltransferase